MSLSLFNAEEIADLINEVGHSLVFLNRSVSIHPDTDLGSPVNYAWTKTPIKAYVVPEARRLIFLSPGAEPLGSGDYIAYIQPSKTFAISLLSSETFVEWEGQNYALEQRESIFHRGRIYLYKFKLKRTKDHLKISTTAPHASQVVSAAEPPAIAQWVDLQSQDASISATAHPNLSLFKTEYGFQSQGVHDWSAWIYLNQVYALGAVGIVVIAHSTSFVGLVPQGAEFNDFPQERFIAGVHFKKVGPQVVIESIMRTDQNFYALEGSPSGQYQCLRFLAVGTELMVEVSEFINGAPANTCLNTSLGPLPEAQLVHLAVIAPHGSITISAYS